MTVRMLRCLAVVLAVVLFCGHAPSPAAAQAGSASPPSPLGRVSAGVTVEHAGQHGTSGLGVTVDADVARWLGVGASATRFFDRQVEQSSAFTAAQFDRSGWSTGLWLRADLLERGGARLYATAGAFYDRLHEEGTLTLYNDAPPYGVTERRIDTAQGRTGGRLGAGVAYRIDPAGGLSLFARPTLMLAGTTSVRLAAGARIPLW
jgi:hypothetical protein